MARQQPDRTSNRAFTSATQFGRALWTTPRIIRKAGVVFWLMFAINAANYLDRLIVVAFSPTLKSEFHLHDSQIGLLSSAFILIYTVTALPLGLLADRASRARIVAVGVAVWSVMSAATAFARNFGVLFATRAAVGIGEASYYPAGTALLSAYFPLKVRARIMSRWQAGQVAGVAVAFLVSALLYVTLGPHLAWRVAFIATGVPGVVLAALMWLVADEPQTDAAPALVSAPADARPPVRLSVFAQVRRVMRIRTIWVVVVLQASVFIVATPAITFLPIYIRSARGPFHLPPAQASLLAGVIIVVGGLIGVLLGGGVADWLGARYRGGRVLAAAMGFGLAIPCFAAMLLTRALPLFLVMGLLAVLALNMQSGPLTAAAQDATPPALRATAVAIILLFSHLLGDVWAPGVVGLISTSHHERSGMALLVVGLPTLAIGAIISVIGARAYAADLAANPPETQADTQEDPAPDLGSIVIDAAGMHH